MIKIALYWIYGVAIPFTAWNQDGSTINQAVACAREEQRGEVLQVIDCVAYGQPTVDMNVCDGSLKLAKVDMPERGIRACVSFKRVDLERLRR